MSAVPATALDFHDPAADRSIGAMLGAPVAAALIGAPTSLTLGFTDPSAAERLLETPELSAVRSDPVLLEALGATADPDLALHGLVRLLEAQPTPTARRVRTSPGHRRH